MLGQIIHIYAWVVLGILVLLLPFLVVYFYAAYWEYKHRDITEILHQEYWKAKMKEKKEVKNETHQ